MNKNQVNLGVRDVPSIPSWLLLSLQHLFAMFGATILVPFLTDLSPAVALVSSGTGTLAYLLITKGRIPAYLGSSFAFIYPIQIVMQTDSAAGVMVGSFLAGLVYGVVSLLIKAFGTKWLMKVLPPIVVGPVIIAIGLSLASTAIGMASNDPEGNYSLLHLSVALATLAVTILGTVFFRGFLKIIPILVGITFGYSLSFILGMVDASGIKEQWNAITSADGIGEFLGAFFRMPDFVIPFVDYAPLDVLNLGIVGIMVPIAIVTLIEHTGDQMVLSKVAGQNFLRKPGLHRSIAGDGIATIIASMLGGPPNTTYGENIGVLAITRVFSVFVIGGAAVLAILFGFTGIVTAIVSAIPTAVMGGVSILLFGIIASSGLRMLTDNQIDLGDNRNLVISSVILVLGVGGASIKIGEHFEMPGVALAAIVGILLNLILPGKEKGYGNGKMFEENVEIKENAEDPAA